MKYPGKKEFEKRGLKRPDFRTHFWRREWRGTWAAIHLGGSVPVMPGTDDWWKWVRLGWKEDERRLLWVKYWFNKYLALKPVLPGVDSGKTVRFLRYQPLGAETGEYK